MSEQNLTEPAPIALEVGEVIHVEQGGVDYGWFKVLSVAPEKIGLEFVPGGPDGAHA